MAAAPMFSVSMVTVDKSVDDWTKRQDPDTPYVQSLKDFQGIFPERLIP